MAIAFKCIDCRRGNGGGYDGSHARVECLACGEAVRALERDMSPGGMIGGFRMGEVIARGGMATVYLARDAEGNPVAVKVFDRPDRHDPRIVRLFLQEIRVHAHVRHPYLVRAISSGQQGGRIYLAMEHLPGGSLHRRITRHGPINEAAAMKLALCIADALEYAWDEHGLVHRDVKPANVLLAADGSPRLADLGLAHESGGVLDEAREDGVIMGTINYTSPEQAAGERDVDFRADMYGLGATLYTALTAKIPFDGDTAADSIRKYNAEGIEDPRRVNPSVSVGAARLLQRLMSVKPRHRFDTWSAARQAIDGTRLGTVELKQRGPSMLQLD